jgi:hypothetical protein
MSEPRDSELSPVVRQAIQVLRDQPDLGPGIEQRVLAELRSASAPAHRRDRGWGLVTAISGLAIAASLGAVALTRLRAGSETPGVSEIRFTISAAAASGVTLVGDFNDWNPAVTPLHRIPATGEWSVTLPLRPGSYRFSFLLDGRIWQSDPLRPAAIDPDFGTPTSVVTVEHSAL